ncbi:unnamed protein product [Bemisia tabaci]|uniref:Uncharacterized protein n=1 Tax=Bemisia tabaci TaxID=7038 RepID=A0A9P0AK62_BEMTA|nr:unnamed protein product [Bemisia tabaci]
MDQREQPRKNSKRPALSPSYGTSTEAVSLLSRPQRRTNVSSAQTKNRPSTMVRGIPKTPTNGEPTPRPTTAIQPQFREPPPSTATSQFSPVSNEELAIQEAEAAYNWWEVATDDEVLVMASPEALTPRAPTPPRPRPAPTPPLLSPILIDCSSPSPDADSAETVRPSPPANPPREHSPLAPRRVLLHNKAVQTPLEFIFSLFNGYQEKNIKKKRRRSVRRASRRQRVDEQPLHPWSHRHAGSFTPRRRHPHPQSPPRHPRATPSPRRRPNRDNPGHR